MRNISTLFFLIMLCFFGTSFVQAQEVERATATQVGYINVENVLITKQEKNTIYLSFDLFNQGETLQSSIMYSGFLVDSNEMIVDETFLGGPLSVDAQAKETFKTLYEISPFLNPGTYTVWVKMMTKGGLPLGSMKAGEISLSEKDVQKGIYVDTVSCFFQVISEKGNLLEEKYTLTQGVDISQKEKLQFSCEGKNSGESELTLYSKISFFERSLFAGEKSSEMIFSDQEFVFSSNATQIFSPVISLENEVLRPQAYDVTVTLVDKEGNAFSKAVNGHFVVQGESATISQVTSDKTTYSKGETAMISYVLIGSADNFSDRRGGGYLVKNVFVEAEIYSKGILCGTARGAVNLESGMVIGSIPVDISSLCQEDVSVLLNVVNSEGESLSTNKATLSSDTKSASFDRMPIIKKIIFVLFSGIALSIFLYFIFVILRRKGIKRTSHTGIKSLVIWGFVLSGLLGLDAKGVLAGTLTIDGATQDINVYWSLSQTMVTPGQNITLTMGASRADCDNDVPSLEANIRVSGGSVNPSSVRWDTVKERTSSEKTATITAPSSVGSYRVTMDFTAQGEAFGPNGMRATGTVDFTVQNPSPTGSISLYDCAIAIGQSSCASFVSWSSSNTTTTPEVYLDSTKIGSGTSSSGQSVTLSYGSHTATLYHGVTTLDSDWSNASCLSGSTWDGSVCKQNPATYICTGSIPSRGYAYSGDSPPIGANLAWQYASTNTERKCEFGCSAGYTWNGSACVSNCSESLVSGSFSPTTIQKGGSMNVRCNYGAQHGNINAEAGASCSFGGWDGTTALFTCGPYANAGSHYVYCKNTYGDCNLRDYLGVLNVQGDPVNGVCSTYPNGVCGYPSTLCQQGTPRTLDDVGSDGTYNWECQGINGGSTAQCSARKLGDAPTAWLTSNKSTAMPGETIALDWSTTNANSCSASGGWSGNKALSGTENISLPDTFAGASFSLTCSSSSCGSAYATAQVGLTPSGVSLTADPTTILLRPGVTTATTRLSWTSTSDMRSCTAKSGPWGPISGVNGTITSNGLTKGSHTFAIECRNDKNKIFRDSVNVRVISLTGIDDLIITADPEEVVFYESEGADIEKQSRIRVEMLNTSNPSNFRCFTESNPLHPEWDRSSFTFPSSGVYEDTVIFTKSDEGDENKFYISCTNRLGTKTIDDYVYIPVVVEEDPADPNLSVSLTATPPTGEIPFTPTLTATVGGTATGDITYEFYCRQNDPVPTSTQSSNVYAGCTYTTAGSYTPKVEVTRDVYTAEGDTTVTATGPSKSIVIKESSNCDGQTISLLLPLKINESTQVTACTSDTNEPLVTTRWTATAGCFTFDPILGATTRVTAGGNVCGETLTANDSTDVYASKSIDVDVTGGGGGDPSDPKDQPAWREVAP